MVAGRITTSQACYVATAAHVGAAISGACPISGRQGGIGFVGDALEVYTSVGRILADR